MMNAMVITPNGTLINVAMTVGKWRSVLVTEIDSVLIVVTIGLDVVESAGHANIVVLVETDVVE
jgi:hypothetical protein